MSRPRPEPLPPRVALISLGCPKNQVDSENLLGSLARTGVALCPDPADAEILLVNTCGFILPARDECRDLLRQWLTRKRRKRSPLRRMAVFGCWVEREGDPLRQEFPDVDLWMGLLTPERITTLADWVARHTRPGSLGPSRVSPWFEGDRPRIGLSHVAYLRVTDGCSNLCSYCTIPAIRGPLRSKPVEMVLDEARTFARQGVSELILIGQDIASFGRDRTGTSQLADLVARLEHEIDVPWTRLMYVHPAQVDEHFLETLSASRRIVHYLDLPLQHVSDRILSGMNRRLTRSRIESLIERLRSIWPDLILRTTFIVGFPGETEEEFSELEEFVGQVRFGRLGVFQYYPEPGTSAAGLPDRVPTGVVASRRDRIMRLQRSVSLELNRSLVGRTIPAIVDFPGDSPHTCVGRTYGDAPDIDNSLVIRTEGPGPVPGTVVPVRVTSGGAYDLRGKIGHVSG